MRGFVNYICNSMVTNNIVTRVFHIMHDDQLGTCFSYDIEGKYYIITAKHLFKGAKPDHVKIRHNNEWKNLGVSHLIFAADGIDIAIFTPHAPLDTFLTANLGLTQRLRLGGDVYFLGFPYGLSSTLTEDYSAKVRQNGYPFPFVKKAIISGWDAYKHQLYLDGINNMGFSGGPVVHMEGAIPTICGIISEYRTQTDNIVVDGKETLFEYKTNTGIIIANTATPIIDLIMKNPFGLDITKNKYYKDKTYTIEKRT